MAMIARVNGTCVICGERFVVGHTEIRWQRIDGQRGVRWCASHGRTLPEDVMQRLRGQLPQQTQETTTQQETQEAHVPHQNTQQSASGSPEQTILQALEQLKGCSKDDAIAIAKETATAVAKQIAEDAIKAGAIARPVTITVQDSKGNARDVGLAHTLLQTLLRMLGVVLNTYLWGAPGGGKTHAAQQAATALGLKFYSISLEPSTLAHALLGYKDVATGTYHSTPFREWFECGGLFLIDELDNAHGSILVALNSALDNGFLTFPDGECVKRHARALLVGTGNTSGRGAHPAFPTRKPFDKAFASRLAYLEWTYDNAMEGAQANAVAESLIDDRDKAQAMAIAWMTYVRSARAYVEQHALPMFVSPRVTFAGLRLLSAGFTAEAVADAMLFQGIESATRQRIVDAVPFPKITVRSI